MKDLPNADFDPVGAASFDKGANIGAFAEIRDSISQADSPMPAPGSCKGVITLEVEIDFEGRSDFFRLFI